MMHAKTRSTQAAAFLLALLVIAPFALAEQDKTIWFGDIKPDDPLDASAVASDDRDQRDMVQRIAAHIADRVIRREQQPQALPTPVVNDRQARIIFISVSDGHRPAQVVFGRGEGCVAAIEDALRQIDLDRSGKTPWRWVKVDFVLEGRQGKPVPLSNRLRLESSLFGVAFEESTGVALLPEELISRALISERGSLMVLAINQYLRDRKPAIQGLPEHGFRENDEQAVCLFRSISYFADDSEVVRLYRGHRLYARQMQMPARGSTQPLTPELLLQSARDAGDYLRRSLKEDGRFEYVYDPRTETTSEEYSLLRHAGTIYSLMELYEVTRDPQVLETARSAIGWLVKQVRPMKYPGAKVAAAVEGEDIKLGGNGLTLVALAKYQQVTDDKQYLETMQQLAGWIKATQLTSGQFAIHRQNARTGKIDDDFVSLYYPGEAMLGLIRLYGLDGQEKWLDVAEKSAKYIILVRQAGLQLNEVPADHWLLMALAELYPLRRGPMLTLKESGPGAPDATRSTPLFLHRSQFIAASILTKQLQNEVFADWNGGYYKPPRSTPTATRSEGLIAALNLLSKHGDVEQQQACPAILDGIDRGVRFQLQTQFRPERVLYLPDPQRPLGGFHYALQAFAIRMDYCQHNISAMLGYRQILKDLARQRISVGED